MSAIAALAWILGTTGCDTTQPSDQALFAQIDVPHPTASDAQLIQEGDTLKITFPAAPSLGTTQVIRRDGRITLPSLGEIKASGLTTSQLEKDILKQFGAELQTKEVSVEIVASGFRVYVLGAVLRPGKIVSERRLTALGAIVEAGGFDEAKANKKAVKITRRETDHTEHYKLNLKRVLDGEDPDSFLLRDSDIVYVPERFQWF